MIRYLFIVVLFFNFNGSFSQTLKINVGRAISSFNSSNKEFNILNKTVNTANIGIGIDLLEKQNYYLSNEISYTTLGGKEVNLFLPEPYNDYEKKWTYVSFSTSFRYKINLDEEKFIFVGVGPKVRFLVDSNDFTETLYKDIYTMEKVTFNALTEIGFIQKISKKYQVGLVGAYDYSMTPYVKTEYNKFRISPLTFNLTFGYTL